MARTQSAMSDTSLQCPSECQSTQPFSCNSSCCMDCVGCWYLSRSCGGVHKRVCQLASTARHSPPVSTPRSTFCGSYSLSVCRSPPACPPSWCARHTHAQAPVRVCVCWPRCCRCCCCSSCRDFRKRRGRDTDPPTPDIKKKMTKRTWDGIVSALMHAACTPQQLRPLLRSGMRASMACRGPRTPSTQPHSCRDNAGHLEWVRGRHHATHSAPSLVTPCTRRLRSPSNPPLPAQMVQPCSTLTPSTQTHTAACRA